MTSDNIGSSQPLNNLQVLLVEDIKMNQLIAKSIIEKSGAIVTIANDGIEAIDKVKCNAFDVILMDLQMPNMDGFEATRVIREQLKLQNLVIIGLSGDAEASSFTACLNVGMNGYIQKPFTPATIVKTIKLAMTEKC